LEPFEKEAEEIQKATLPEKGQKGFQPNVVENLPPHKPEKATDKAGQALGVSGQGQANMQNMCVRNGHRKKSSS
jgi:hypothetical protein